MGANSGHRVMGIDCEKRRGTLPVRGWREFGEPSPSERGARRGSLLVLLDDLFLLLDLFLDDHVNVQAKGRRGPGDG